LKGVQKPTGVGRRRGGRSAYQQEQRDITRKNLLGAGLSVFTEKPYFEATIDDLVQAGGVSRAAFYMHFESKLDLALAVFKSGVGSVREMYEALPFLKADDLPAVRQWLDQLLRLYREQVYILRLHAELDAFEPRFQAHQDTLNDGLIEAFAKSLPRFRAALTHEESSIYIRVKTIMMVKQVGTICAMLAMREKVEHEEVYVEILTELLNGFLTENQS
jgi:AcrR family transcriptional regulator